MGVVNTQYTFAANDVITSTKMNDIIDQTTVTDDAILGNTLEVAGGKLKVRAQGITSNELATNAVTNTQITNLSVTPSKLSTGAPNWDTNGNLNINNGLYVTGGTTLNGSAGINGNLGVAGYVDCGAVYFGDDAGLLYDSGVGSVTIRYGTTGAEKFSTFGADGALIVGGAVASTIGNFRSQNWGGVANRGIYFFGDGNNYIYHTGSNFEFKFGADINATLSSSGTIWTSGNDGAGSGLDADLLDGLETSAANAVNTIVRRDVNGNSGFNIVYATTFSGNANTATNLSTTRSTWATNGTVSAVVGQLSWNNFGNNHTIFDASQGVTPSGTACDRTNSDVGWSSNLPTLMGWNGTSTHGVRVDSAKYAGTASYAENSGWSNNSNAATYATRAGNGPEDGTFYQSNTANVNKIYVGGFGTNKGSGIMCQKPLNEVAQALVFIRETGAPVGSIVIDNANSTNFNTTSDYRLKEDFIPVADGLLKVNALKPTNFKWVDMDTRIDGFIAHEVQEIVPNAVTGEKDVVDDNNDPIYQQIDASRLIPIMVAAIQELSKKVAELES